MQQREEERLLEEDQPETRADTTELLNIDEQPEATEFDTAALKNSEQIGQYAFAAFDVTTGKLENADDAANLVNYGRFYKNSGGDDSVKTGDSGGTVKWSVRGGRQIGPVSVAGASGASDRGKPVYPTDNQTLTLTPPSNGAPPIGLVKRHKSGTNVFIQLFPWMEAFLWGLLGTDLRREHIATVHSSALSGTSALKLATLDQIGRGQIEDFYAVVNFKGAAAAGSQTFTLKIGGVAVTGASLVVDKDSAQGAKIHSTPITAANIFSHKNDLELHMSAGGTGFDANDTIVSFFIVRRNLPGA